MAKKYKYASYDHSLKVLSLHETDVAKSVGHDYYILPDDWDIDDTNKNKLEYSLSEERVIVKDGEFLTLADNEAYLKHLYVTGDAEDLDEVKRLLYICRKNKTFVKYDKNKGSSVLSMLSGKGVNFVYFLGVNVSATHANGKSIEYLLKEVVPLPLIGRQVHNTKVTKNSGFACVFVAQAQSGNKNAWHRFSIHSLQLEDKAGNPKLILPIKDLSWISNHNYGNYVSYMAGQFFLVVSGYFTNDFVIPAGYKIRMNFNKLLLSGHASKTQPVIMGDVLRFLYIY